jgi:hypothetical protein
VLTGRNDDAHVECGGRVRARQGPDGDTASTLLRAGRFGLEPVEGHRRSPSPSSRRPMLVRRKANRFRSRETARSPVLSSSRKPFEGPSGSWHRLAPSKSPSKAVSPFRPSFLRAELCHRTPQGASPLGRLWRGEDLRCLARPFMGNVQSSPPHPPFHTLEPSSAGGRERRLESSPPCSFYLQITPSDLLYHSPKK